MLLFTTTIIGTIFSSGGDQVSASLGGLDRQSPAVLSHPGHMSQKIRQTAPQRDISCITLRRHVQFESGPSRHIWECELLDSSGTILTLEGLDNVKTPAIVEQFESGVSVITIPGGIVDELSIQIPSNARIQVDNSNSMSRRMLASGRSHNSTDNYWKNHHRSLVEGTRKVLAIRVIDVDGVSTTSNAYEMSDKIFGPRGNNLVTQYNACSYGKLQFAPTRALKAGDPRLTTAGVYEVRLPVRVKGMTESQVRTHVTNQLRKDFPITGLPGGYKNYHTDASSPFDHVMYCLPPGTTGGWIASGYENSWLSTYNDRWCNMLSAQMHEISHNLNNHHSGDAQAISDLAKRYGDQSGYMGSLYGQENGPLMCFNAAKSWQLGWYADKAVLVSPSTSSWSGKIMGISDYGDPRTSTVLLKLETGTNEDYYVNFNRKAGINRDVRDGGNQVLVIKQGGNGVGYSESERVAMLSSGRSFTIPNFGQSGRTVEIKVDRISTSPSVGPGYADVSIKMSCTSDSHCERDAMFACSSFCNRNTNTCEIKAGCNCDYTCNSRTEDLFQCPSDCLAPQVLETSTVNDGVHTGNMFDIEAKNEVQITRFEIDVQNQGMYVNAYVYTKVGGYDGSEVNPVVWRHIQTARVQSRGENELTNLPSLPNPIVVPAGRRQSFYITLESNDMSYTEAQAGRALFASDDNIEFFSGIGIGYPFKYGIRSRIFNGRIVYVEVPSVEVATLPGVTTVQQSDIRPPPVKETPALVVTKPPSVPKPPVISSGKKESKKERRKRNMDRRRQRRRRFRRGAF